MAVQFLWLFLLLYPAVIDCEAPSKTTLLDGRSGFTLLHGGGGGGGGYSGGVGDGSGGHVKILAGNITEKADYGGMLNLQSGKGPLGSGNAFFSTMDSVAGTGGIMVRSGHTFTNVSNVDDDVLKYRVNGGSGNVQFASGDALYHGNKNTIKKDMRSLTHYLPFLGRSGNISIMSGYATRKGGDILLNGGDVAVPKNQHEVEHSDDYLDLNGELKNDLQSGNIRLRGGSIIEFDDNNMKSIDLHGSSTPSYGSDGVGGDIDIAPGRGSEAAREGDVESEDKEAASQRGAIRKARRRHGRIIMRDHSLEERLVINGSHSLMLGNQIYMRSSVTDINSLDNSSFLTCRSSGLIPHNAPNSGELPDEQFYKLSFDEMRQFTLRSPGAMNQLAKCSGMFMESPKTDGGVSQQVKHRHPNEHHADLMSLNLFSEGKVLIGSGGGWDIENEFYASTSYASYLPKPPPVPSKNSKSKTEDIPTPVSQMYDVVIHAGPSARSSSSMSSKSGAAIVGSQDGGNVHIRGGKSKGYFNAQVQKRKSRGGSLILESGESNEFGGYSGDTHILTGIADNRKINGKTTGVTAGGTGRVTISSGDAVLGDGVPGRGGISGDVVMKTGAGEKSGKMLMSPGPAVEFAGSAFLLGGDATSPLYLGMPKNRAALRNVNEIIGGQDTVPNHGNGFSAGGDGGGVTIRSGGSFSANTGGVLLESAPVGNIGMNFANWTKDDLSASPRTNLDSVNEGAGSSIINDLSVRLSSQYSLDATHNTVPTDQWSGDILIRTGKGSDGGLRGGSGHLLIGTGSNAGTDAVSGNVVVKAGDSVKGNGGSLTLHAGASGGTGGSVPPKTHGDRLLNNVFDGDGGSVDIQSGWGEKSSGDVVMHTRHVFDCPFKSQESCGGHARKALFKSGGISIATGSTKNAGRGVGNITLATGDGSSLPGHPYTGSIFLKVGTRLALQKDDGSISHPLTRTHLEKNRPFQKGGSLVLQAGHSDDGDGGDVEISVGDSRVSENDKMGRYQVGGTLKLMAANGQLRFLGNDTDAACDAGAQGSFSARGGATGLYTGVPPYKELNLIHLDAEFQKGTAVLNFPLQDRPVGISGLESASDSITSYVGAVLYLNATPDELHNENSVGEKVGGGDGGSVVLATWGLSNGIDIVAGASVANLGVRVRSGDIFETNAVSAPVRLFSGDSSSMTGNVTISTGNIKQPTLHENIPFELRSGNVEIRSGNCDKRTGVAENSNSYCYAGAVKIQGGEGSGGGGEGLSGGGGKVELMGGFGHHQARGGVVDIKGGISANGLGGDLRLTSGSNAYACHVGAQGLVAECGSGSVSISSGFSNGGTTGPVNIMSGDAGKGKAGNVLIAGGKSNEGAGSEVKILSGEGKGGQGGLLNLTTGMGSGQSKDVAFGSGDLVLGTGVTVGHKTASGSVSIQTGETDHGKSGDLTLATGPSLLETGSIVISTGTAGNGKWKPNAIDFEASSNKHPLHMASYLEKDGTNPSGGSLSLLAGDAKSARETMNGVGGSITLKPGLGGLAPERRDGYDRKSLTPANRNEWEKLYRTYKARLQPEELRSERSNFDLNPFDGSVYINSPLGDNRIVANGSSVSVTSPFVSLDSWGDAEFKAGGRLVISAAGDSLIKRFKSIKRDKRGVPISNSESDREGGDETAFEREDIDHGSRILLDGGGLGGSVSQQASGFYGIGHVEFKSGDADINDVTVAHLQRGGSGRLKGGNVLISAGGARDVELNNTIDAQYGGDIVINGGMGSGKGAGGKVNITSGSAEMGLSGSIVLNSGLAHKQHGKSGSIIIASGQVGPQGYLGGAEALRNAMVAAQEVASTATSEASTHFKTMGGAIRVPESIDDLDVDAIVALAALSPKGASGHLKLASGDATFGSAGSVEVSAGTSGFGDGANVTIQAGAGGAGLRGLVVLDHHSGKIGKISNKPKFSSLSHLSSGTKYGDDIGYSGGGLGSGVGGDTIIEGGYARSYRTGRVIISTPESYANASGDVVLSTGNSGSDYLSISTLLSKTGQPPQFDSKETANYLYEFGGAWYRSGELKLNTGSATFARAGDITLKSGSTVWPAKAPDIRVEAELARPSTQVKTEDFFKDSFELSQATAELYLKRRKSKRRGSEVVVESGASEGFASVGGSVRMISGKGEQASGSIEIETASTSHRISRDGGVVGGSASGNLMLTTGSTIAGNTGQVVMRTGDTKDGLSGNIELLVGSTHANIDVLKATAREVEEERLAFEKEIWLRAQEASLSESPELLTDDMRLKLSQKFDLNHPLDNESPQLGSIEDYPKAGAVRLAAGNSKVVAGGDVMIDAGSSGIAINTEIHKQATGGVMEGGSVRIRGAGGRYDRLVANSSNVHVTAPYVSLDAWADTSVKAGGHMKFALTASVSEKHFGKSNLHDEAREESSRDEVEKSVKADVSWLQFSPTQTELSSSSPLSIRSIAATSRNIPQLEAAQLHRERFKQTKSDFDDDFSFYDVSDAKGISMLVDDSHLHAGGWINISGGNSVGSHSGGLILKSGDAKEGSCFDDGSFREFDDHIAKSNARKLREAKLDKNGNKIGYKLVSGNSGPASFLSGRAFGAGATSGNIVISSGKSLGTPLPQFRHNYHDTDLLDSHEGDPNEAKRELSPLEELMRQEKADNDLDNERRGRLVEDGWLSAKTGDVTLTSGDAPFGVAGAVLLKAGSSGVAFKIDVSEEGNDSKLLIDEKFESAGNVKIQGGAVLIPDSIHTVNGVTFNAHSNNVNALLNGGNVDIESGVSNIGPSGAIRIKTAQQSYGISSGGILISSGETDLDKLPQNFKATRSLSPYTGDIDLKTGNSVGSSGDVLIGAGVASGDDQVASNLGKNALISSATEPNERSSTGLSELKAAGGTATMKGGDALKGSGGGLNLLGGDGLLGGGQVLIRAGQSGESAPSETPVVKAYHGLLFLEHSGDIKANQYNNVNFESEDFERSHFATQPDGGNIVVLSGNANFSLSEAMERNIIKSVLQVKKSAREVYAEQHGLSDIDANAPFNYALYDYHHDANEGMLYHGGKLYLSAGNARKNGVGGNTTLSGGSGKFGGGSVYIKGGEGMVYKTQSEIDKENSEDLDMDDGKLGKKKKHAKKDFQGLDDYETKGGDIVMQAGEGTRASGSIMLLSGVDPHNLTKLNDDFFNTSIILKTKISDTIRRNGHANRDKKGGISSATLSLGNNGVVLEVDVKSNNHNAKLDIKSNGNLFLGHTFEVENKNIELVKGNSENKGDGDIEQEKKSFATTVFEERDGFYVSSRIKSTFKSDDSVNEASADQDTSSLFTASDVMVLAEGLGSSASLISKQGPVQISTLQHDAYSETLPFSFEYNNHRELNYDYNASILLVPDTRRGGGVGLGSLFNEKYRRKPNSLFHILDGVPQYEMDDDYYKNALKSSSGSHAANEQSVDSMNNIKKMLMATPPMNSLLSVQSSNSDSGMTILAGHTRATSLNEFDQYGSSVLWLSIDPLDSYSGGHAFLRLDPPSLVTNHIKTKTEASGGENKDLPSDVHSGLKRSSHLRLGVGKGDTSSLSSRKSSQFHDSSKQNAQESAKSGVVINEDGYVGIGGGFNSPPPIQNSKSSKKHSSTTMVEQYDINISAPLHVKKDPTVDIPSLAIEPLALLEGESNGVVMELLSRQLEKVSLQSSASSIVLAEQSNDSEEYRWTLSQLTSVPKQTTKKATKQLTSMRHGGAFVIFSDSNHSQNRRVQDIYTEIEKYQVNSKYGEMHKVSSTSSSTGHGDAFPSLWLDTNGNIGLSGYGSPNNALSVSGDIEANDVLVVADERLLGLSPSSSSLSAAQVKKRDDFLANTAPDFAQNVLRELSVEICYPPELSTQSAKKSFDILKRRGYENVFHSKQEMDQSDVSGSGMRNKNNENSKLYPYLCISAQKLESVIENNIISNHKSIKNENEINIMNSIINTDSDGYKSLSLNKFVMFLLMNLKKTQTEVDRIVAHIASAGGLGDKVTSSLSSLFANSNAGKTKSAESSPAAAASSTSTILLEARLSKLEASMLSHHAKQPSPVDQSTCSSSTGKDRDLETLNKRIETLEYSTRTASQESISSLNKMAEGIKINHDLSSSNIALQFNQSQNRLEHEIDMLKLELSKSKEKTASLELELETHSKKYDDFMQKMKKEYEDKVELLALKIKSEVMEETNKLIEKQVKTALSAAATERSITSVEDDAEKESDYLRKYYFDEIGRLEQDLRTARTSSGGGGGGALGGQAGGKGGNVAAILTPLSTNERNTLREQALLATKERMADLKRLRDIGIGIGM